MVVTTATFPAYKSAKRLATFSVMTKALFSGIVASISITNIPWSRIKVVASENATENSPQLRNVAESSAAYCSAHHGPSTLHLSEREAESSSGWDSCGEGKVPGPCSFQTVEKRPFAHAVKTKQHDPPARRGRTCWHFCVQVISIPYSNQLQPRIDALHRQHLRAHELGARRFHFCLEILLATKVGNQTGQCRYERTVAQSVILSLPDEGSSMQSRTDAHGRKLSGLFKPCLNTRDTVDHRALPISTKRIEVGAPQWVNNLQNSGAEAQLGLPDLIVEQRNCSNMNICQLPVVGTNVNSQM